MIEHMQDNLTITEVRKSLQCKEVNTVYIQVKATLDDMSSIEISKFKAMQLFRHFPGKEIAEVTYYKDSRSLWIG